jgi:hypothetical protein
MNYLNTKKYFILIFETMFFTVLLLSNIAIAETNWLNVKNYGAAGNGIKDDTIAIQSAVDAANLIHGVVYFPAGTYKCRQVNLRSNICLFGDEAEIRCANLLNNNLFVGNDISDLRCDGLTINGNSLNNSNYSQANLIFLNRCNNVDLENCNFIDASQSGVCFYDSNNCDIISCRFDKSIDNGISLTNSQRIKLNYNSFFNISSSAVYGINAASFCFSSNIIYNCSSGVFFISDGEIANQIQIIGNQIRTIAINGNLPDTQFQKGTAIFLKGINNGVVQSNRIENCQCEAIILQGVQDSIISGNNIRYSDVPNSVTGRRTGISISYIPFSDTAPNNLWRPSSGCSIKSNIVFGCIDYGICESGYGGQGNVFIANVCKSNGRDLVIMGNSSISQANIYSTNGSGLNYKDFNFDGIVNFYDFVLFANYWFSAGQ